MDCSFFLFGCHEKIEIYLDETSFGERVALFGVSATVEFGQLKQEYEK